MSPRPSPHAAAAAYRPDIDGLRAIAVISVVLYHAFPGLLPGGFAGVDVFFVISGFLIGGILIDAHANGTFTYRDFYTRRVRRLFPALVVVLAVVLLVGFFLLMPSAYRTLGKHVLAGAGFASNLVLLKESGYFDTASALKPLLHLWSLGVEEQFYILCPLVLAAFWRSRLSLPVAILLFALASFAVGLYWLDQAPKKAFFHPAARFWELFAGVWLAAWQRQSAAAGIAPMARAARVPPELAAAAGLLFLSAAFVWLREGDGFPGMQALLPVFGAMLLVGPAAGSALSRHLLASRPMVFVGVISYPLYLWHWPLLSLARIERGGEPSTAVRAGLVLLAVALAWATWRWVETPLRHARAGSSATRILVVAMVIVALAGAFVFHTDGISARYPAPVRAVAGFEYDSKADARAGSCFLKTEQPAADFAPECLAPADSALRPRVVLWGDSHAGHLYPGLRDLAAGAPGFALVQLTASGCPPVVGMSVDARPACRKTNDYVMGEIVRRRPEVVVLAGFWYQYRGRDGWNTLDPAMLRATITQLLAAGVARVVVVGQVPIWSEAQPSVIIRLWDEQQLIVDRTAFELDPGSLEADENLRTALEGSGAAYVSPTALFCVAGECMTFADKERTMPVAFDYGHLTPAGSLRVAHAIRNAFIPQ